MITWSIQISQDRCTLWISWHQHLMTTSLWFAFLELKVQSPKKTSSLNSRQVWILRHKQVIACEVKSIWNQFKRYEDFWRHLLKAKSCRSEVWNPQVSIWNWAPCTPNVTQIEEIMRLRGSRQKVLTWITTSWSVTSATSHHLFSRSRCTLFELFWVGNLVPSCHCMICYDMLCSAMLWWFCLQSLLEDSHSTSNPQWVHSISLIPLDAKCVWIIAL